jgi:hypothetical protein
VRAGRDIDIANRVNFADIAAEHHGCANLSEEVLVVVQFLNAKLLRGADRAVVRRMGLAAVATETNFVAAGHVPNSSSRAVRSHLSLQRTIFAMSEDRTRFANRVARLLLAIVPVY